MRHVLFLALLALSCCGPAAPEPDAGGISRACVRSFPPTLDAWEAALSDVPAACRNLDAQVDVQLVAAEDMPCDEPVGVNQVRTECTQPDVIYLNQALDDVALVDASVHGWVHQLELCVYGRIDRDHLRGKLWAVYGVDTVELQAQAAAELGSCL